jgi:hypothetical protein
LLNKQRDHKVANHRNLQGGFALGLFLSEASLRNFKTRNPGNKQQNTSSQIQDERIQTIAINPKPKQNKESALP